MLFHYSLHSRRLLRRNWPQLLRGFSLLEIVLALFILGILAAFAAPALSESVARGKVEAEKKALGELDAAIQASFESTDLSALNVAALPGTIGAGDLATEFSTSSTGTYSTTNTNSWFAKVARARGIIPSLGVPPSATVQPALGQLVTNTYGNPRYLFAGPVETGRQRFLLVSVMAPSGQLVLPACDGTAAWFDAIWNADWESRTAALPTGWTGRLNAAQLAAWGAGPAGLTGAWRLCVRRIVLNKYVVRVNNNHPTASGFLSFNNVANAFTAAPASGATTTPEILAGRLITVNQGSAWPGVEALRFHLQQNDTVIIQ